MCGSIAFNVDFERTVCIVAVPSIFCKQCIVCKVLVSSVLTSVHCLYRCSAFTVDFERVVYVVILSFILRWTLSLHGFGVFSVVFELIIYTTLLSYCSLWTIFNWFNVFIIKFERNSYMLLVFSLFTFSGFCTWF